MKKLMMAALLALSFSASAALLETKHEGTNPDGTKTASAKMEKVTLSSSAKISGTEHSLVPVGAGLRSKKVILVNVKVYVGQLFVSDLSTFKKDLEGALASVTNQKAIAIQLHFLRNVDAENVQVSFRDALKVNKVDLENSAIKEFLTAVNQSGEAKNGKAMTILGMKNDDGSEVIKYESTEGKVTEIKGSEGFIKNIFAIWLGKPSDDGVKNLKSSILK